MMMATNDIDYAIEVLHRLSSEWSSVIEQRIDDDEEQTYFETNNGNIDEQFVRDIVLEQVEAELESDGKVWQSPSYIVGLMNWNNIMLFARSAHEYELELRNGNSDSEDVSNCLVITEECDDNPSN